MNTSTVHRWAAGRGMASRIVGLGALALAQDRLGRLADEGSLDPGFVQGWLSGFTYLRGLSVAAPRSLVLLAVPRPAHLVSFDLDEGPLELVIPPTYVAYRPTFVRVRDEMRRDLGLAPDELDVVSAPLRSLAAASGLVRYGRNNLGYVDGLGSYVQLVALVTSFELEPDGELRPIEERGMDLCRKCTLCLKACLPGAIGRDRFLLRAERCFTRFSESAEPIPDTMPSPSSDCLIGCLKCQEVCPVNRGRLKKEPSGLAFVGEEARAFAAEPERRDPEAWGRAAAKIATLGTTEKGERFARNLRLILERRRQGRTSRTGERQ